MTDPVVSVSDIETRFGPVLVHRGVSFDVMPGSLVGLIGGSGAGKSVLLKVMIGLLRPSAGHVSVLGTKVWESSESELEALRRRIGVLFQNGALFSNLSVAQNVGVPYEEQMHLERGVASKLIDLRLALSAFPLDSRDKLPSELSGGMRKRAALARAIALEPELLFLDEPTSGLDPINARAFDQLVRTLCKAMGITVVLVTHDLDTIESIVDRLIVLGDGKILADGTVEEVKRVGHPWIREYFESRGKRER